MYSTGRYMYLLGGKVEPAARAGGRMRMYDETQTQKQTQTQMKVLVECKMVEVTVASVCRTSRRWRHTQHMYPVEN